MIRQLPYVLFLTFLGVIYIGNRFHAEQMVRQINELKIEVGNLRVRTDYNNIRIDEYQQAFGSGCPG